MGWILIILLTYFSVESWVARKTRIFYFRRFFTNCKIFFNFAVAFCDCQLSIAFIKSRQWKLPLKAVEKFWNRIRLATTDKITNKKAGLITNKIFTVFWLIKNYKKGVYVLGKNSLLTKSIFFQSFFVLGRKRLLFFQKKPFLCGIEIQFLIHFEGETVL